MGRRFVIKNPNGPPSKSQVRFAIRLGISIPEGVTRGELDKMIEEALTADRDLKD